ncbi:MAG: pyridoxamine 5'-phosphate oxidase family protein [Thermoleophilia bacterium]|nr:pyridoxamine 5'-phosphate oxidase family protein [Thermoleophilia bacterium]MDH5279810.1 pyridoxamine 5'-phosphate oxidase family protein [Thermoleophilia bacterium]
MSDPAPSRRLDGSAVLGDALVRELLGARLIGVLATLDLIGSIHAVPMWYAVDEGCILLATGSRSRKVRNLQNDPRATLVVHDSRPGFEVCGASIAGQAAIVRGREARGLVDRVHGRYVAEGADEDAAVHEFFVSDDVALRLQPVTALTWDERGSPASTALRTRGEALPLVPTEPR